MENTVKNPAEYGYCKDGKVYLKGYLEYPDRLIGVVRNTEEEALQYATIFGEFVDELTA